MFAFQISAAEALLAGEKLEDGQYFYSRAPDSPDSNKFALLVHGFNVRPELMEPVITMLTQAGIPTLFVVLSGHRPESEMTLPNWQKDMQKALSLAELLADESEIVVFGHSLGAALATISRRYQDKSA